jgi:hypothetical protein
MNRKKALCWLGMAPAIISVISVACYMLYIVVMKAPMFFLCALAGVGVSLLFAWSWRKYTDLQWEEEVRNSPVIFDPNDPNDEGWNTGLHGPERKETKTEHV